MPFRIQGERIRALLRRPESRMRLSAIQPFGLLTFNEPGSLLGAMLLTCETEGVSPVRRASLQAGRSAG